MCRIAIEPAEVKVILRLDVVAQRTVVATAVELRCQRSGEFHLFGNFIRSQPTVSQMQGLVVQIAIHITLSFPVVHDAFIAPSGPVMGGE